MQVNRLFEIVYILMGKELVTARTLAEHFGVSQRTIYRDIDVLSLAGVPVYTEKGKGGGISLLPDFVLNKSILSEREQTEILSALQGLKSMNIQDVGQVIDKLSTVFNKQTVNWLEVDFSEWGGATDDAFHALKGAILDRFIIEFDYYSASGTKEGRRAEPIQIWFKAKAWYLRAFCLDRQDVRLFKLTRMKRIAVLGECFSPRDLINDKQDAVETACDCDLVMRIAPERVYRAYDEFDEKQFEIQKDGSAVVSIAWPLDEWVYGFILSFGEHIEVLSPDFVRAGVVKRIREIANIYA